MHIFGTHNVCIWETVPWFKFCWEKWTVWHSYRHFLLWPLVILSLNWNHLHPVTQMYTNNRGDPFLASIQSNSFQFIFFLYFFFLYKPSIVRKWSSGLRFLFMNISRSSDLVPWSPNLHWYKGWFVFPPNLTSWDLLVLNFISKYNCTCPLLAWDVY